MHRISIGVAGTFALMLCTGIALAQATSPVAGTNGRCRGGGGC